MSSSKDRPASKPWTGGDLVCRIKNAARGRWNELLQAAGLPAECLDGRGRPCPRCGGKDRFNAAKDVCESGALFCRHCFNKSSQVKPGDGIASVAWLLGMTNREAMKWLADRLGLNGERIQDQVGMDAEDIITAVCRDKRMPIDAFKLFGAREANRGRERTPVARVDLYNEAGQVHSYFDLWPGGKGKCKHGNGSSGLFLPGKKPAAGEHWVIVEGPKDAAVLQGLGFDAAGIPTNKLSPKYAQLFADVHVVIFPDLDLAGVSGAEYTARNLWGVAASVAIARLPGPVVEKHGLDVRDVLQQSDGESSIRKAVEEAIAWKPKENLSPFDRRPEVKVTMDEAAVAEEVVRCLGRLGWDTPWIGLNRSESVRVFVRGGTLVHAVECDDIDGKGRLVLRDLPACLIRERITQACSLVTEKETEDDIEVVPMRPPSWLIEAIYRRGTYGGAVQPLTGIVHSPTIRIDGSVLQTPGYDPTTGLIFHPSTDFPSVPDNPTRLDASNAILELKEVLADFPIFDEADASAWISMVLSMIGRPCIDGCVPMFVVTANVRGAGKSLLVDAATLIAYGHRAARKVFTRDDAELEKLITSVALAGTPSVLFDNLDVQLGGASLDAVLTSSKWSGRILGQSRLTGNLPMRTVWGVTGNNISLGSDVARRVLPIRLRSPHETPEDRSGFRIPDLLAWIEAERPRLAVSALTILKAYFAAGCPAQPGGAWGSFECWSSIVRGSIVWAGGADPLRTRETAIAGDDTAALLGKLIVGIEKADPTGVGLTTKEIERKTVGRDAEDADHETLSEAVYEICGDRFNGRKFGRRLRGFLGRIWQGRFLDAEAARGGVARWRVRIVDDDGFGGFGGSKSPRSDFDVKFSQTDCNAGETSNQDSLSTIESRPPKSNPPNQPNPPSDQIGGVSIDTLVKGSVVEI